MSDSKRVPLAGTEHLALAGVRTVGPTDPHQLIEVSVVLKHRRPLPAVSEIGQQVTHSDFAQTYGADPAAVDKKENHR